MPLAARNRGFSEIDWHALRQVAGQRKGVRVEYFAAFQAWAVIVAAPSILCWLLGERHGAARIRRLVEVAEPGTHPAHHAFSAAAPESAVQPCPALLARSQEDREAVDDLIGQSGAAISDLHEPGVADGDSSETRRAMFADMPALSELHEQAAQIRRGSRIWDDPRADHRLRETDPIAARVLRHYKASINELVRVTAKRGVAREDCKSTLPPRLDV